MEKEPKVLTRMRLSCCWGDTLNEKELNEIVNYIEYLQRQNKKQKEIIDKIRKEVNKQYTIMGCEVVENWVLLQILEDKEVIK